MYLIMTVSISHSLLGFAVFLLLQDIQAGNRKQNSRPNQLLPNRKKLTVKDTYKILIILCLWYLISYSKCRQDDEETKNDSFPQSIKRNLLILPDRHTIKCIFSIKKNFCILFRTQFTCHYVFLRIVH
jgi:hypothetical protein